MDPQEPRSDASGIERSDSDGLRNHQEGESEQGCLCGVPREKNEVGFASSLLKLLPKRVYIC